MPNYYEILKIAPTADTAEIESVLDAQYEQWSNLVTHQDPKLQLQAQQALQIIEQMRTTLLDPVRRQVYNEAIGLSGAAGGLVDPNIVLQMPAGLGTPMTPHTPPAPTATQAPAQPAGSGLWTCSKGQDNPPDTRYCLRCGEELVRTCPECGQLKSLRSTGMCGNCGYKYEVAFERKALSERISALSKKVEDLRSQLAQLSKSPWGYWSTRLFLCGLITLVVAGGEYFALGPFYGHAGNTDALVWTLIGGTTVGGVLLRYFSVSSDQRTSANNLKAEMEEKQREISRARQRYDELSLRRTGE